MTEPYVRPGDYRPRDACGRQLPRQLDAVTFMRALSGLAYRFRREVPREFVDGPEEPDTGLVGASVRCVCGAETGVLPVAVFVSCPGECGRVFLNTAASIRVARLDDVDDG
jgi:hypothetical protein